MMAIINWKFWECSVVWLNFGNDAEFCSKKNRQKNNYSNFKNYRQDNMLHCVREKGGLKKIRSNTETKFAFSSMVEKFSIIGSLNQSKD